MEHQIPLGDSGWVLWRDAALRGTGFPARRLLEICDDELAAAADQLDERAAQSRARYTEAFAAAAVRLSAAIRRTASDSGFREAVTWQNPQLVRQCLDKVVAGRRRDDRGRYYELTIASYLQRFCLKNDSIGFFGPIGWARLESEDGGLTTVPGPALVSRRTTYFESWAIEAIAELVAARAEVWPWLKPRMVPWAGLTGWVLHLPLTRPVTLTAAEFRLLRRCDGTRTVRDLVGVPPDVRTLAALLRLRERGAVQIDLSGAQNAWPERDLAARIAAIGDPGVRERAAAPLHELTAARDAVSAAAGQPDRLATAAAELAGTFERLTGREGTRMGGQFYVGRTLVCEDTVRDTEVHIGRKLTDRLAPPLGLVLDSARWLVEALGRAYEKEASRVLDRSPAGEMQLLPLMAEILPELLRPSQVTPDSALVDAVTSDFQDRWRRVLNLPGEATDQARRHDVFVDDIAARAAEEFPAGAAGWTSARWHSPDLMVVADDPEAMASGDVDFVLGELHCGGNTLESRALVSQHPDPARLRAAAEASGLDGRVVFVPRRDTARTAGRVSRSPDALLPGWTYICSGPEAFTPPAGATVLSLMDLSVHRSGDRVIVRHRDGAEFPLLEVIGEPLIALFLSGFRPVGVDRHRPRVTVDRMVLSREAWRFAPAELDWAFTKDESLRYARARKWRAERDLPERAFYTVPIERKPIAVDFRSLALVNLLAKAVRRSVEAGVEAVTLTEMLPDLDGLWLTDAAGDRYTAELRLVAVSPT